MRAFFLTTLTLTLLTNFQASVRAATRVNFSETLRFEETEYSMIAVNSQPSFNPLLSVPYPPDSQPIESPKALDDLQHHWAKSFIEPLIQQGIIQTFNDGTFRPDQPITWAEFTTMLQKAFGGNMALMPSLEQPHQPISRVQTLVALVEILNLRSLQLKPEFLDQYFLDAANIPDGVRSQVAVATENRLIVNYPNLRVLNPNRNATRAEVSAFIYQGLVNQGQMPRLAQTSRTSTATLSQRLPSNPRAIQPTISAVVSGNSEELEYTLGAGDVIAIDVTNFPEYSKQYRVLVDGSIQVPLLGKVSVKGLTLPQVNQLLYQQLSRTLRRPEINVNLVESRPLKFAVSGEVNRPGAYAMSMTESNPTTLSQAVQLAGGITQSANLKEVQVRRSLKSGQAQILVVNLWDLLQNGDLSQDLNLRDGDSIFIPTNSAIDLAESPQLVTTNLYPKEIQPIKIALVGEVVRPGPYTLQGEEENSAVLTVTQAIQAAGGITSTADLRQVKIRRLTRTGGEQEINVDLFSLLKEGDLRQDAILQDGDTIIVATAPQLTPSDATELARSTFSPAEIQVNVVGELVQPGVVQVPPNSPLNQAILAAGGFNNRANKGIVELIRLAPNGTVEKREINVDFSQGLGENSNPILRNNDIVVVRRSGNAQFSDGVGSVLSPLSSMLPLVTFLKIFGLF